MVVVLYAHQEKYVKVRFAFNKFCAIEFEVNVIGQGLYFMLHDLEILAKVDISLTTCLENHLYTRKMHRLLVLRILLL